jgi:hypothetical protein
MTNPNTGLSTGADPGFLAGFLAGEIQRDYMGSILDVEDAVGLDLKGQPKKKQHFTALGACSCDATNCKATCCSVGVVTEGPKCKTHHNGCHSPKPPKTPPKGPTKRASWFSQP